MAVCDGCGARADDPHIQRRIERLELATKFRPVHIKLLFLDGAPPVRIEDYFYRAAKDRSVRSVASRMQFDELAKCAGSDTQGEINEEQALIDFQRRGLFLTYAVECPFEDQEDPQGALRRLAPTVMKRVQTSYIPTYIAPISQATRELIRLFGLIGWGDRLLLDKGGPWVDPYLGDAQHQAEFGTAYGAKIKQILSQLP